MPEARLCESAGKRRSVSPRHLCGINNNLLSRKGVEDISSDISSVACAAMASPPSRLPASAATVRIDMLTHSSLACIQELQCFDFRAAGKATTPRSLELVGTASKFALNSATVRLHSEAHARHLAYFCCCATLSAAKAQRCAPSSRGWTTARDRNFLPICQSLRPYILSRHGVFVP